MGRVSDCEDRKKLISFKFAAPSPTGRKPGRPYPAGVAPKQGKRERDAMPKKTLTFPASEARKLGLLMDEAAKQKKAAEWLKEDHEKLLMLCRQYDIQDGNFYGLALALARELCPERKKSGVKVKWTGLSKGALVVEIERLVKPDDPMHGDTWAAKQLSIKEPWKSFLKLSKNPAEVLRRAYYDFGKDKWADLMREAFKMCEHEGRISEWDEQVTDFVRNLHPN
jgi:hypothetical protein